MGTSFLHLHTYLWGRSSELRALSICVWRAPGPEPGLEERPGQTSEAAWDSFRFCHGGSRQLKKTAVLPRQRV